MSMGQDAEEAMQQLSAAIDQDVDHAVSWQQMVAGIQSEDSMAAYTEQLSSDPPSQDHVGLNMGPLVTEAQDGPPSQDHVGLSSDPPSQYHVGINMGPLVTETDPSSLGLELKVGLQIGLSSHSNNKITRIFDFTLGKNRSNTIYRLRILGLFNFVLHVIAGVPYLLEFLHGVDLAHMVMFIITIGVPIAIAVISVLVSCWSVSDRGSNERSNWITGLLVANFFTFGGHLAFNLVPAQGTRN